MSTIKLTLLAIVALATLSTSIGAIRLQDGPEPINLSGPRTVSSGGTYRYTVTVASTSSARTAAPFDTTVNVACDSPENWIDLPATVTIPAGHTSAYFDVTVAPDVIISLDTMTASNANGSVEAEILILD